MKKSKNLRPVKKKLIAKSRTKPIPLTVTLLILAILMIGIYFLPQIQSIAGGNSITGLAVGITNDENTPPDSKDVMIWQGQYYIGDQFQQGTYKFNFDVYDAKVGGALLF